MHKAPGFKPPELLKKQTRTRSYRQWVEEESVFFGYRLLQVVHAPVDGPTPNHIATALSGGSGLKRNEKLGREL